MSLVTIHPGLVKPMVAGENTNYERLYVQEVGIISDLQPG